MDPAIRASPYEAGLYFVSPEPGTTLQSIGTTEWKVRRTFPIIHSLPRSSLNFFLCPFCLPTGRRAVQAPKGLRIWFILLRVPCHRHHHRRTCRSKTNWRRPPFRRPSQTSPSRNFHSPPHNPPKFNRPSRLLSTPICHWSMPYDQRQIS
jgi:hypothetical protein